MKKIISILLLVVMAFSLFSCDNGIVTTDTNSKEEISKIDHDSVIFPAVVLNKNLIYYATIDIVDYGTIKVQLNQEEAPLTVANFVSHVETGFYTGLTFHRIIEGFMMQGGDPDGNGTGGSKKNVVGEFSSNNYANSISHKRGVISMARSKDMNSASSQFFIVHQDSPHLDGDYAAFGNVVEGIEVVDKVCEQAEPTDGNGTIPAKKQPVIRSITITTEERTDVEIDLGAKYFADIEIANHGTITLELNADEAPITVNNFVSLAESGFYDGLTFHRIIEGFMMQGGDPEGTGFGGSEKPIFGEFAANGHSNSISHKRGVVSMARTDDYNSASSQFFIVHQDSTFLDGKYAAFGVVTDGIEIVDDICESATPSDTNGTIPAEQQPIITKITIRKE